MRLRLHPRLHLPAAIPLASLLAAVLLAGPARAAVPPLPDDLSPKEWKPPKELRQIFDDFDAVEGFEELRAFADRVQPVLEKHPDWVDLHRFAIGLARQLDEMPEARAKYEAWVERDSTNAAAQYLLGILEGPGGEKRLRKALELDPQSYYARCGLGLLLLGGNDPRPDEAFPLLFEAARMRPDHPYAYHAIALGYEMSRDWETGLRVRRMAEVVEPSSFQPVQYEMKDLQQLKRGDEVLGRLEAFVEEHPKDRHAQRALVQTYLELNRVGDAIRVQTGLAEQATDYPDETYRAALLLARAGRRDEALDWLKR
ncbi:MAG: hypothetical protein QUU85_06090, partial [Candidatus Eisenbacteria bacterium]|nr:hypothetical protein [Candidatus Eisenbacteria bacterium]